MAAQNLFPTTTNKCASCSASRCLASPVYAAAALDLHLNRKRFITMSSPFNYKYGRVSANSLAFRLKKLLRNLRAASTHKLNLRFAQLCLCEAAQSKSSTLADRRRRLMAHYVRHELHLNPQDGLRKLYAHYVRRSIARTSCAQE